MLRTHREEERSTYLDGLLKNEEVKASARAGGGSGSRETHGRGPALRPALVQSQLSTAEREREREKTHDPGGLGEELDDLRAVRLLDEGRALPLRLLDLAVRRPLVLCSRSMCQYGSRTERRRRTHRIDGGGRRGARSGSRGRRAVRARANATLRRRLGARSGQGSRTTGMRGCGVPRRTVVTRARGQASSDDEEEARKDGETGRTSSQRRGSHRREVLRRRHWRARARKKLKRARAARKVRKREEVRTSGGESGTWPRSACERTSRLLNS